MKIEALTLLALTPWWGQQFDVMVDTDRAPQSTSVGVWIEIDNTQHPEIGINGWCQMPCYQATVGDQQR